MCSVLFVFQTAAVAQNDYHIKRPRVAVANPIFCNLVDTAIFEMKKCGHIDSGSFYIYLFEMKGEGSYHCWLETHTFSSEIQEYLPEKWDDGVGSELYWPEGYFYYKGVLCLVRTYYPGVNFVFSDEVDMILLPIQDNETPQKTEKGFENSISFMLIYPSLVGNGIDYPFQIKIGCQ